MSRLQLCPPESALALPPHFLPRIHDAAIGSDAIFVPRNLVMSSLVPRRSQTKRIFSAKPLESVLLSSYQATSPPEVSFKTAGNMGAMERAVSDDLARGGWENSYGAGAWDLPGAFGIVLCCALLPRRIGGVRTSELQLVSRLINFCRSLGYKKGEEEIPPVTRLMYIIIYIRVLNITRQDR